MRKKLTTYILLLAVLSLWGFIAYKVYNGLSGSETPVITKRSSSFNLEEPQESNTDQEFIFNYRDPFLKSNSSIIEVKKENQSKSNSVIRSAKNSSRINQQPSLKYYGMLKKLNEDLAIVKMNEIDQLLKIGDQVGEFFLQKIYDDSLIISNKELEITIEIAKQ